MITLPIVSIKIRGVVVNAYCICNEILTAPAVFMHVKATNVYKCFILYNNGFTSYYLGFFLYISNTTNLAYGILCHHDTTYTKHTIPNWLSVKCHYYGQFVIYYNERLPGVKDPPGYSADAFADLCEVQVFGMSFVSLYPMNCVPFILFLTIDSLQDLSAE